jgi:hypothetical protein
MRKIITYREGDKDTIVALIEQNNGATFVRHQALGRNSSGKWVINVTFLDELEGLCFMKALRDYDGIRYEVA